MKERELPDAYPPLRSRPSNLHNGYARRSSRPIRNVNPPLLILVTFESLVVFREENKSSLLKYM